MAGKAAWIAKVERLFDRIPADILPVVTTFVRQHYESERDVTSRERDVLRDVKNDHCSVVPEVLPKVPVSKVRKAVKLLNYAYEQYPGFLDFWKKYPIKVGKGDAFLRWKGHDCEQKSQEILAAIVARNGFREREGGDYRPPNPATWLNQRRWDDDPPKPKSGGFRGISL